MMPERNERMSIKRAIWVILGILLLFTCVRASESEEDTEEKKYNLYYINSSRTGIDEEKFVPERNSVSYILQYLVDTYNTGHRESTMRYLPENVTIETWSMEDNILTLNLSEEYREMDSMTEILVRAAFVKTFTQFPEVLFVLCTVEGEDILDASGNVIKEMSSDTFADVSSTDRDAYRYDTFTLYFTDKDSEKLIPETRRVYYRRSIPKTRVALEQLANGPMEKGHYPTITSEASLLGAVISDGICYVDYDNIFTERMLYEVPPEISVYSVAHTIMANTEAEKIEILINGNSEETFGDLDLYQFFGWNEELSPIEEG